MTVSLKHQFHSLKGDGTDPTKIQPSNWNEEHVLEMASGKVLGRATASVGPVEEIDWTAFGRSWLNAADASTARGLLGPVSNLANQSATYKKLQLASAAARLLGSNANAAKTITGAANNGSGLIRLTVADTTGFLTGQTKVVAGVLGTVEANDAWVVTVVDSTHIDLQGSTFANVYSSGGTIGGGFEEISLGGGLAMNGSVLSASSPGAIYGLNTSNGASAATDITVAPGSCRDALDTTNIVLPATITKQINVLWAAGTNQGGRSTASLADGTWHVFVIAKPDGTADAFFHNTINPAGVLPSGYTVYRRVASIVRVSSILAYTQWNDNFELTTPILDVSANDPGSSAVTRTLTVPTGIVVTAKIRAVLTNTDANTAVANGVIISPLSSANEAVSATNFDISPALNNAGGFSANNTMRLEIRTNTSGQIRSRNGVTNSLVNLYIRTLGWIDDRGRSS